MNQTRSVGWAVALLASAACSEVSGPSDQLVEGAQTLVTVSSLVEITDRATGKTTTIEDPISGTFTARTRMGRLAFEWPEARAGLMTTDSYALDDTVVQRLAPMLGFTTGANGAYTAPLSPSAMYDSVSTYVDSLGVTVTSVMQFGSWGQPLNQREYIDGVLNAKINWNWTSISGGYKLSWIRVEDLQQPDVIIRTTFTMTSSNTVILSGIERLFEWSPALNTSTSERALSFLAGLCLPAPAYAATAAWSCHARAAVAIFKGLAEIAVGGASMVYAARTSNPGGVKAGIAMAMLGFVTAIDGAQQYAACPKS